ncbi:MAG: ABC transporter ATP-binding protein [Synergistota bacterium]|nr:ABC transporter ATP-binding protein [Synergistota bacterium]
MIRLRDVTRTFGDVTALRGLSLDIPEGELFGLMGPDGAGKTTALRILAGVSIPDSGDASIGQNGNAPLGYMPQRFSLYEDFTIMENLRFFGSLWGLSGRDLANRAENLLDRTGLLRFRKRLTGHLSGGMKQKLALSAALLHRPRVLLLDEPGTGVDPVSRREFWRILYELHGDGLTILITTPYMDEAQLCQRVGFIHKGALIALGAPAELKAKYPFRVIVVSGPPGELHPLVPLIRKLDIGDVTPFGDTLHVAAKDATEAGDLIRRLLGDRPAKFSIDEAEPSLEDLFVQLAHGGTS